MCLLKTGACLMQVHFSVFSFFGNLLHACLIQVACLIEAATETGFTVCLKLNYNVFRLSASLSTLPSSIVTLRLLKPDH